MIYLDMSLRQTLQLYSSAGDIIVVLSLSLFIIIIIILFRYLCVCVCVRFCDKSGHRFV